jgi:hypothetical protein
LAAATRLWPLSLQITTCDLRPLPPFCGCLWPSPSVPGRCAVSSVSGRCRCASSSSPLLFTMDPHSHYPYPGQYALCDKCGNPWSLERHAECPTYALCDKCGNLPSCPMVSHQLQSCDAQVPSKSWTLQDPDNLIDLVDPQDSDILIDLSWENI